MLVNKLTSYSGEDTAEGVARATGVESAKARRVVWRTLCVAVQA